MLTDVLRPRRDLSTLLLAIAVVALALRFVGLGDAPPGFHVDEAVNAAQIVCLAETGADANGRPTPLNAVWQAPTGAVVFPASNLYPGVLWVKVFGDGVGALRAYGVAISIVLTVATAAVAYNFFDRRGFAWALLLGAVMPWSWDLSRTLLAAGGLAGLAAALIAVFVLTRARAAQPVGPIAAAIAGLGFATALGYNNTRAIAVVMALLLLPTRFLRGLLALPSLVALVVGGVIGSIPVLTLLGSGQLLDRTSTVSILNSTWLQESGTAGVLGIVTAFVRHLGLHLSPRFLFVTGDAELRHNSGITGQLGWLELGLTLLVPVAVWLAWRSSTRPVPPLYLAVVGSGIFAGLATASLTTSALPHAQRAVGAVPFIVLGLTAVAVSVSIRWALTPAVAAVTCVLFGAWFLPQYFGDFPDASAENFNAFIRISADTAEANGDMGPSIEEFRTWQPQEMFRYFTAAAEGGLGCPGPTAIGPT